MSNAKFSILVGVAILLIFAIYQQKVNNSPFTTTSSLPSVSNITEDERFILNPPPATASAEKKKKHAEIVTKLAKEGNLVEIKDCKPTPLVLQVKQGSEFKIKNNDNVNHNIIIDSEHAYELPTNNQLTIKAEFKYGPADYGYICEGAGLVGFFHIIL